MADTKDRDAARSRAQTHFSASEQRDSLVKQMIEAERVATAAKTAKLRALRLAKEEADRLEAANAPKQESAPKTRARKAAAKKS